jgi:short-subunit dehydrogenase
MEIKKNYKTVIITGGTSGIGKALAIKYASEGYAVVVSGRDMNRLQITDRELRKIHENILTVCADVSIQDDCERLISEAVKHFKGIDILINNAGISMRAVVNESDLNVLQKVVNTNFWGAVYCTKFALPYILDAKGSVVGISSIAGKKGLPGRSGYSASKFALEGFLESLRTENIKKGLHVLVASPGFTESAIRSNALGATGQPQKESPRNEKKMMRAEKVAGFIFDAVRRRKRDLILTTEGKLTVLLNRFFPNFTDKLVFKHMSSEPGSPF